MKGKYHLKNWVKELLITILMVIVVCGATAIYLHRLNKINNGTITIQCDCDMDK